MFGHSASLNSTSSTLDALTLDELIFPSDLHSDITSFFSMEPLLEILTAVVLGQSILSITKCLPMTLMDCFASARSLPFSVWNNIQGLNN